MLDTYITEPERKIPVKKFYDTVVAGGGIAGISAALAAARCGARVLLAEREYMLGGLATAGLVTIYLPLCDGNGRQVSFGIAEELLRLSASRGFEGHYSATWMNGGSAEDRRGKRFEIQYNPYVFAILAEQILKENGVDILYGSAVCDTAVRNGRITHLIFENKSGRFAAETVNVIDATGDADVCRISGEETVVFKQGNVPASWYYAVKNGKYQLRELGFSDIPDSQKTPEQLAADRKSKRFAGLDGDELTELTLLAHRTLLEDFFKDGEDSPEHSLASVAFIPQIRMTRRIAGIYTQDDTELHREYADSVGLFSDWRKRGPVYELPFSALYGSKILNLITAGRCISVTDAMWDITRVIPVCAVSGQAAGTAAALTDDFSRTDLGRLQERLRSGGVVLHENELKADQI